jgi:hypothetical protein
MSTNERKPHAGNAGYVCELKCRLGGHVVVYDRESGCEISADHRWIVMHEPSSLHVAVHSQSQARDVMKGVARAKSIDEACGYADILPQPGRDDELETATPADQTSDQEREQLLERFMADPENEPSEEGKAALRKAFTFDYSKRRK